MTGPDKHPEKTVPLAKVDTSIQPDPFLLISGQVGETLRQKAEAVFRKKGGASTEAHQPLSLEETRRTLHELQVHQIELKMQNDQLRQTQAELDHARTRYFDLYDLAPVGYCTVSDLGLILEANLTAAAMLGEVRPALVKQPLFRFIVDADQDIYYLCSRQLLKMYSPDRQSPGQAGDPQACELRMVQKNGTIFWAHLKMSVVQDATGNPVFLAVMSDISERKQTETDRIEREARNRRHEKTDSLERMAAAIAHLFNNQLCVVLGNLEMVMDGLAADAAIREHLLAAARAARRSSEIGGLLLTYLGQNNARLDLLDLSEICRQHLQRVQIDIPRGIIVKTNFVAPGPVVQANPSQIQLVVTHLLTNSWEAIGNRPGKITVTTSVTPAAEITASHIFPADWRSVAKSFAVLSVTDTGYGITSVALDRIFDPFFSTKFTGRGLGLAVVMGLIKAWGGMIGVDSSVGKGSTMQIFLPLIIGEMPRKTEPPAEFQNIEKRGGVMVVDDQDVVRHVAETMLKRLGFTVFSAASGREAVTLYHRHQKNIQCLITDLSMPGMDGWETLAALRKIQPNLPAIMVSGYDESEAMSGDHTERPEAFLHKPYAMDEMLNALNRILRSQATS